MRSIKVFFLYINYCISISNFDKSFIESYFKWKTICETEDNIVLPRNDSININLIYHQRSWSLNSKEIDYLAVRNHFKLFD